MYVLQKKPDKEARTKTGLLEPIATLKNEYGQIFHIATDDHCFVLYSKQSDTTCVPVTHWFREAVEALKTLPLPK